MYKPQHRIADAMRSMNLKTLAEQQQHQNTTADVETKRHNHSYQYSRHPHHHHEHHGHQKLHSQHPHVGIAREPLRQHPNGQQSQQPQQRQPACKKRPESEVPSWHGSCTLESVKDVAEPEPDGPAEEFARAGAGQLQQRKRIPCLNRSAVLPANVPDVDLNGHCTMVSVYAKDIFVYLAEREVHYALPEHFLAGHVEVTERARTVLVDWLLQLSSRLELQVDTYHLGVRLLDHYLAVDRSFSKRQLQLLGATALWLASKFEEVYCISVSDLLHVCSGVCNRRDLLAMEVQLVGALDFRLLPPLPITFLRRLSKVAGVDNRMHYAAKYLLELATLCTRLAWRPASQLAAAAMRVALGSDGRGWSDLLVFYSGYALDDLRPAAAELARACVRAASSSAVASEPEARHHRFVYQKYRSGKCFSVAACAQLLPESQYLANLIAEDAGHTKA